MNIEKKLTDLKNIIKSLGSLAVGFSGGVDSSFLLAIAHEVLGKNVLAVTCRHIAVPEWEIEEAKSFCAERNIRQLIFELDPLVIEEFRINKPDRCYACKRRIFSEIRRIASENEIAFVAEGSNMDDLGDYRPGLRAISELDICSPLREAGLYKSEIRELSRAMNLPTWDKPAYACLASRFVYGEEITGEKLGMVERAEEFLIENGFADERVRMHGKLARIEVPEKDIPRFADEKLRIRLVEEFKNIGFLFVTLDLSGYSTGSMNKTIDLS